LAKNQELITSKSLRAHSSSDMHIKIVAAKVLTLAGLNNLPEFTPQLSISNSTKPCKSRTEMFPNRKRKDQPMKQAQEH